MATRRGGLFYGRMIMKIAAIDLEGYTKVDSARLFHNGVEQDNKQILAADTDLNTIYRYKIEGGNRVKGIGDTFERELVKVDGVIEIKDIKPESQDISQRVFIVHQLSLYSYARADSVSELYILGFPVYKKVGSIRLIFGFRWGS